MTADRTARVPHAATAVGALAASLVCLAAGCGDSNEPEPPRLAGRIAFAGAFQGGQGIQRDIWVVNADGGGMRNVTSDAGDEDAGPDFSPDGRRIAYTRYAPATGTNIWLVNADGTAQTNVTGGVASLVSASRPSWSPDGARLAFESMLEGGAEGLAVIGANGTGFQPLGEGSQPDWSPDGMRIAMTFDGAGNFPGIHVMSSAGANRVRISPPAGGPGTVVVESAPAWSPDGGEIAFARRTTTTTPPFTSRWRIGAMRADGTGRRWITDETGESQTAPAWSPDGKHIAFESSRDGSSQLYVARADGSGGLQQVTRAPAGSSGTQNSHPSWTGTQ